MATKKKSTRSRTVSGIPSGHQVPGIGTLIPELRSDVKWKPTGGAASFAVPGTPLAYLCVWNFGVPFAEMQRVNTWLAANELTLAGLLKAIMDARPSTDPKVFYLGTYLNIDSGTPMYQTYWGYTTEAGLDQETAWPNPIPSAIRSLIVELRQFWVRDPGRSEVRFGSAAQYTNVAGMPNNGPMLQITVEAAS